MFRLKVTHGTQAEIEAMNRLLQLTIPCDDHEKRWSSTSSLTSCTFPTYRDPARVHGICEEYRAAATIDVEHDRADKEAGKRIECPMLHLWTEGGPLDTFHAKDGGSLGIRRQWALGAQGQAMKGGHFLPEENPDGTLVLVKQFLSVRQLSRILWCGQCKRGRCVNSRRH
jgi:pimeloyl-ACP methyl ester carboxylesterase